MVQQLHSWALTQRNEHLHSYKNLYTNVHCSFIHNSQKLGWPKRSPMMNGYTVVYPYHGMPFNDKMRQTIDIHYNLDRSQGDYTK